MALDKGETALAEVAKRKAEQVETESIGKLYLQVYENQEFSKEVLLKLVSGNDIDMHLHVSIITKMFLFAESFDGFDDGLLQNGYHNNNAQNHSDFNVNEVCEL